MLNIRLDEEDEDLPGNPVTTANVRLQTTGDYTYTAGFLPAGPYTVALTFEADLDDPTEDTPIEFVDWDDDVQLEAGEREVVDFPTENYVGDEPDEEDE